ncbi:MAG: PQQ-binding-like beta-propeller repeat protein [Fimbriimonadaceae bacterium]|nr:PQQ-binding-like beta-propeller repeat protein [Fimbriimonadaceae bacterium]
MITVKIREALVFGLMRLEVYTGMRTSRIIAIGTLALGLLGSALAQFSGPIPLAWRWAYSTPVSPTGAPVVSKGMVYAAVGQRMFALDMETGNQKWRYPLADPIPGYFRNGLVLVGDVVVAVGDNQIVYGVTADRGEAKWAYASDVPIVGQPVVVGNIVLFMLSDSTLMAINGATGEKVWNAPYKVFAGLTGQLASYGNSVLFYSSDNSLTSLNVLSMKVDWNRRFTNVNTDSQPAVYGDYVYASAGSYVVCLTARSGGVRWQQNTGEPLMFAPAVSSEGVFAVTRDGKAFLYEPLGGAPKLRGKTIELGSYPSVRPSAAGKMFVQPTTAGSIVAVNPATGDVVWSFLIRPLAGTSFTTEDPSSSGRGGSGRGGGAGFGGGGGGGGLAGGGGAGGAGGQAQPPTNQIPLAIPASGPVVLSGKTLLVLAQDGSLLAFDPDNGVDLTGPKINMIWPNPGDLVGGPPLEMLISIDDEATGVNSSTVRIEVDGEEMEFEYGRDGLAIVRISPYTKNKPLSNGRRTIKVTATDWMGNTTVKEYGVTVDNALPPSVRPASTNPGQTGGRTGGPGTGTGGGGRVGGGGL